MSDGNWRFSLFFFLLTAQDPKCVPKENLKARSLLRSGLLIVSLFSCVVIVMTLFFSLLLDSFQLSLRVYVDLLFPKKYLLCTTSFQRQKKLRKTQKKTQKQIQQKRLVKKKGEILKEGGGRTPLRSTLRDVLITVTQSAFILLFWGYI